MKKLFITTVILFITVIAYCQPALSAAEKEGTGLYQAGKTTEAIAAFKKALAETPKSLYSINALGNLYYSNRQYQDAYAIADEGMKLSGGAPNFMVVKAKAGIMTNKAQEALTMIDQYIASHQPDFMLLFIKGTAYDALGDRQQALNFFNQSIAANPNYPDVYLTRGKDFAELERWPLAIQDYGKFIAIFPDDPDGYAWRGVAYYRTNKLDEAIADYTKAIQLDPRQLDALNNRGLIYRERKQTAMALADFDAAIALNPDNGDAYYNTAFLYKETKDYNKALTFINKAVTLQTSHPHFYAMQSMILLYLDKNTEAISAAEKVLQLDHKNWDGFIAKASAYYNMQKYDDALTTINSGIAVLPDNYLLYGLRASIYKAKGNTTLADADDAKAKQLAANVK